MHRAQVDAHLKLTKMTQRSRRWLVIQGKALDAQRPWRIGLALQQVEVSAAQTHPGNIGKVHQATQLHAQLLLVEVPQAALEAGQVTDTDQRHARVDITHFTSVLEVQLHRAGEHGKAQAEQQDEQQQTPQQTTGLQAAHRASAGRLIMSR
ncbi:hypothetical protein D3C78_970970 [compost metagenome]